MIDPKCFTAEWLDLKQRGLGLQGDHLLEKAIHAFALLGLLVDHGVPLIFKGGTSLLLRLPGVKRLSIDIDIVCGWDWEELESALAQVSLKHPFIRHIEDDRGDQRLPERRHYKFFYEPCRPRGNASTHVLLDVVKESQLHPAVEEVVIRTPLFEVEREVAVRVPTIEGLLGDKLTAFAPNTIGVRLTPDGKTQVVKQLFDVAQLFDAARDFAAVPAAYDAISAAEIGYRGGNHTREQCLQDTISAARLITLHGLRGSEASAEADLLLKGRASLLSHLVEAQFGVPEMKTAAAKAGCLAKLLLDGRAHLLAEDSRFDRNDIPALARMRIPADPKLEVVKKQSPEAFHYWAIAHGLVGPR